MPSFVYESNIFPSCVTHHEVYCPYCCACSKESILTILYWLFPSKFIELISLLSFSKSSETALANLWIKSWADIPLRFLSYSLMWASEETYSRVVFNWLIVLCSVICLSRNILVTPRMNFAALGLRRIGKSFLSVILTNSSASSLEHPVRCIYSFFAASIDLDSCDSVKILCRCLCIVSEIIWLILLYDFS